MKTHRTDGVSFTFGLVFLAIVAWYVAARSVDLSLPTVGWLVAAGLILLGLLGLAGALRSGQTESADLPTSAGNAEAESPRTTEPPPGTAD